MWIQSMSQFITGSSETNSETNSETTSETNSETNTETKTINELELELFFMKQILQFPGSMVGNMYIKKKQGNKVWIDKLKVTAEELLTLDMDDDVKQWLQDKNMKYKDNDW